MIEVALGVVIAIGAIVLIVSARALWAIYMGSLCQGCGGVLSREPTSEPPTPSGRIRIRRVWYCRACGRRK